MANIEKIHTGVIKLGEYDLPCYVVDNGGQIERVLTQREVVKLITGGRESGNLKRYLKSRALEEVLPPEIVRDYDSNVLKINAGTYSINGVKASTVVDICNSYLKARQLGLLTPNQINLAEQSEIFISALAKTGIDAVIDEATGYQYFRKANELQEKLQAYIVDGYREWTKTFPKEFFMHLYRLEGKTPPLKDQPYPKRFGKYLMHYVYDTLDPEIADFLRDNNPNPSGKKHHHQKFSDFGHKALTDHLFSILGIIKASPNIDLFKQNLAFAFPNARTRRRNRLSVNKAEKQKQKDEQLGQQAMFDILPTSDNWRQTSLFEDDIEDNLSDFNKSLKTAINHKPKRED